jgi:serine protease Do
VFDLALEDGSDGGVSLVRVRAPRTVFSPGEIYRLQVWRDGGTKTLQVDIGESPAEEKVARAEGPAIGSGGELGLALSRLNPEARERYNVAKDVEGVLVGRVKPNSPAAQQGIRAGDVIIQVGNQVVTEPEQVISEIKKRIRTKKETILMRMARGGDYRFVAVRIA